MLRIYWISLFTVGLTLALQCPALGQEQAVQDELSESAQQNDGGSSEEGEENAPAEQAIGAPAGPSATEPTSEVEVANEEQEPQSNKRDRDDRILGDTPAQFWMMIASMAAVVVSAIAVALVYLTLNEVRSTTRAAVISTKLGRRTLDHVRNATRAELRPYISAAPVSLRLTQLPSAPGNGKLMNVKITVETVNAGQTPAYRTTIKGGIRIVDAGDDFPEIGDIGASSPQMMVGPNRINSSGSISKPVNISSELRSGAQKLLVYGVVNYSAADGGSYYTAFCGVIANLRAMLDAVPDREIKADEIIEIPNMIWQTTPKGNDAD